MKRYLAGGLAAGALAVAVVESFWSAGLFRNREPAPDVTPAPQFDAAPAASEPPGGPELDVARSATLLGRADLPCVDFVAFASARGLDGREAQECEVAIVRATDRAPLPFAEIEVELGGGTLPPGWKGDEIVVGRSDGDGRLRVRTSMTVVVGAHVEGYAWTQDQVGPIGSTSPLVLALEPQLRLEGTLTDDDGNPVAGATLSALGLSKPTRHAWGGCGNGWRAYQQSVGKTDEQGRFGPIECAARGVASFVLSRDVGSDLLFPPFSLADAPGATRFVALRLPHAVPLTGTLRHADGATVLYSTIHVVREFDHWSPRCLEIVPDEEGRFRAELPAAGRYRLASARVGAANAILAGAEIEVGAGGATIDLVDPRPSPPPTPVEPEDEDEDDAEESGASPEALASEEVEEVDDEPGDVGAIHGRARCACTSESRHFLFAVLMLDGEVVSTDECDDAGEFRFEALDPQSYAVRVLGSGHEAVAIDAVAVQAGRTTEVAVQPTALLPTWRGRVTNLRGDPVAGAQVNLRLPGGVPGSGCVDEGETEEDGSFTLASFREACEIVVSRSGAADVRFRFEQVPSEESRRLRVFSRRTIRGRVEIAGGVPGRSSLEILGESREHRKLADVYLDVEGRFELPEITGETFELVLVRDVAYCGGVEIARRVVPAGDDAVDLGAWELAVTR